MSRPIDQYSITSSTLSVRVARAWDSRIRRRRRSISSRYAVVAAMASTSEASRRAGGWLIRGPRYAAARTATTSARHRDRRTLLIHTILRSADGALVGVR